LALRALSLRPNELLLKLQQSLIDAVAPFYGENWDRLRRSYDPEEPGHQQPDNH